MSFAEQMREQTTKTYTETEQQHGIQAAMRDWICLH